MATGVGYRLYRLSLAELALWIVASLVLAFLVLPLLVIIPISFSSGAFLTFPPPGFSLRWYQVLASEEPWRRAFQNSLIVGAVATTIATVLGTLAALGIARLSFRGKSLLTAVLISPMIVPVIIVGTGVYFFFSPLGLTGSLLGLALAHAALGAPFVLITVSASLAGLDERYLRAAASLGADPATTFRRVTLPLITPGVVSGALFAFITSFDEVVIALFLTGPGERTLPRQMFDGIRENISPTILAAATVLIVLAVILLVTTELLRRRNLRLRGVIE
ncbi:MAG TPA: ABC transporter permease [Geminicoccaceae bacterium]|nr:ABC transporter permease [Geminicoccaceae bacterium]